MKDYLESLEQVTQVQLLVLPDAHIWNDTVT